MIQKSKSETPAKTSPSSIISKEIESDSLIEASLGSTSEKSSSVFENEQFKKINKGETCNGFTQSSVNRGKKLQKFFGI